MAVKPVLGGIPAAICEGESWYCKQERIKTAR